MHVTAHACSRTPPRHRAPCQVGIKAGSCLGNYARQRSNAAATTHVFSGMGGDSGAKGQEPAQSGGALAHDGGDDEDEEEMRQLEEALRMSSMTFIDDDPELAEVMPCLSRLAVHARAM